MFHCRFNPPLCKRLRAAVGPLHSWLTSRVSQENGSLHLLSIVTTVYLKLIEQPDWLVPAASATRCSVVAVTSRIMDHIPFVCFCQTSIEKCDHFERGIDCHKKKRRNKKSLSHFKSGGEEGNGNFVFLNYLFVELLTCRHQTICIMQHQFHFLHAEGPVRQISTQRNEDHFYSPQYM